MSTGLVALVSVVVLTVGAAKAGDSKAVVGASSAKLHSQAPKALRALVVLAVRGLLPVGGVSVIMALGALLCLLCSY
jgi:hypothetical protein